jgi:hypothetical protein
LFSSSCFILHITYRNFEINQSYITWKDGTGFSGITTKNRVITISSFYQYSERSQPMDHICVLCYPCAFLVILCHPAWWKITILKQKTCFVNVVFLAMMSGSFIHGYLLCRWASVTTSKTTEYDNPEHHNPHFHHCENLKSHTLLMLPVSGSTTAVSNDSA